MNRKKDKGMVPFVLAIMLTVTMVLSGCAGKEANQPASGTSTASPAASESSSASESPAEAPKLEPAVLTWYFPGGVQNGQAEVEAAMNKILQEKINATIQLKPTDWGEYDQKLQLMNASGESYDLAFTANWMNNYYTNVSKDVFLPLDDLLDQYAPAIMKTIPQMGWDALKVNGKKYAVPNYQIWAKTDAVTFQKELLQSTGFNTDTIKAFADIEPFLAAVKEKHPDLYPFQITRGNFGGTLNVSYGYDEAAGRNIPGVVRLDDSSMQVVNQFESEEYKNHLALMRSWFQKGYIRKDAATLSDDSADFAAGKYASFLTGNLKPGGESETAAKLEGREVKDVALSKPYLLTSSIIATMTAVSKSSKNPERAIMFLDLLYSDKELFNTLAHGIEGKHYNKLDDVTVEAIIDGGYSPNADWLYGNQFSGYYRKGQQPGIWEETIELNNSAAPSPLIGFNFDPTPVKSELAQTATVTDQYIPMLETGSVDPEKYLPEFIDKLKRAGSDKIVAEIQKQIDAWKQ